MSNGCAFIPCSIFPLTDMTTVFLVVLCIILFAPLMLNRLRIPHIIGMILAGVLLGEHGLNIITFDSTFKGLGRIGLYYLMFLAGLEMNLEDLRKNRNRSLLFGLLTYGIPFFTGWMAGNYLLGFHWGTSMLLGAVLGSHTLISYPIVGRYGLNKQDCVVLSVGATLVALLAALLTLAGVSKAVSGNMGTMFWALFAAKCLLFSVIVIVVFPRLARWFFRRYADKVLQYIFVLTLLCLSAILSQTAGLDGIFGTFLCGVVLNRYIPHISPLMNRIEFVGNALFIPYFLIGVGMIIDVQCLFGGWTTLHLILLVLLLGTASKWMAALTAQKLFGMTPAERRMMFGLSNAHAAGALAMAMVGVGIEVLPGQPLIDDNLLNGIVILILFSCIVSSLFTEGASRRIIRSAKFLRGESLKSQEVILISYSNPETVSVLTDTALLLRHPQKGSRYIGLHVTLNNEKRDETQQQGRAMLEEAAQISASADVCLSTQCRIGVNVANSILHTALECEATEVILGLHQKNNKLDSFFGSILNELINGTGKQVMIVKCGQPVNTLRRIVIYVPVDMEFEAGFYKGLEKLSRMGEQLGCQVHFYAHLSTLKLIRLFVQQRHTSLRFKGFEIGSLSHFREQVTINPDHLLVLFSPRRGSVSWKESIEHLPDDITQYYRDAHLMFLFPDLFGETRENTSFTEPVQAEQRQLYTVIKHWFVKEFRK